MGFAMDGNMTADVAYEEAAVPIDRVLDSARPRGRTGPRLLRAEARNDDRDRAADSSEYQHQIERDTIELDGALDFTE